MIIFSFIMATISTLASPALADDPNVIASMDENRFATPPTKARADVVEGKIGKAVRFRFDDKAQSTFFTSNIRGTPDWDKAAGFSFWVKGDGADGFGGVQFIYDDDYAVRYDLAFPVKGIVWTKVTVAWDDLIPVLPGPRAKPLGTPEGHKPSKLTGLWIGKWWYWGDYPAVAFAVDEIRLEPKIERDAKDYRPDGPPLARTLAKLKAGKPITIVTMGDSLTDKRHWANREVAWVDLLRDRIRETYRIDATIVNPAIGGTQLRQNLVLMPRWLAKAPEPDLVTVFFGGNDWESGMRGPEFEKTCADAADRVRRQTRGKSDVLILTTNPSADKFATELAASCRAAAKGRNCGLADTENAFRLAGKDGLAALFVDDRVHLSRAGHKLVADAVLKAIEASGR